MRRLIVALTVVALIAGCCRYPDLGSFRRLSLQAKIAALRDAERNHCRPGEPLSEYFAAVASHGAAARDAVLPWLRSNDPYFTKFDAIVVLRYVASDGVDIESARPLLRQIAVEDPDPETRRAASRLIAKAPSK